MSELYPFIEPLRTFIEERHLDGRATLTDESPLLEWGIIDSLAMADLMLFIEQSFAVQVPLEAIIPANFRTLDAIASMLTSLPRDECRVDRRIPS